METNNKISIHDIDRDKLIELFSQYGYKTEEENRGKFIVFSLQTGMYPAIEIVPYRNDIESEIKDIKDSYSKSGYAVKISQGTTISEIENYLFNGFFHVEMTNKRIIQKYIDYAVVQMGFFFQN